MSTDPTPAATDGVLEQVLTDLRSEGDGLVGLVGDLDDAGWRTLTPAPGWSVAHQVAHLAWTDEVAVAAADDGPAWESVVLAAMADPDGFVDHEAAAGAEQAGSDLLARFESSRGALGARLRRVPAGTRLPWFGPPMSATSMATARFMETWAHARDVAEALGRRLPATDSVRHVAHLGVRTRDFAFAAHGLEAPTGDVRVELTSPSGKTWTWGEEATQSVHGSAEDFALLVTQRVHRGDTALVARGGDADRWLDVAQCFAGAPGTGRQPRA